MALVFLAVALVAGLFSFGLIADMALGMAQIVFFVFLALAFISLLGSALQGSAVSTR